MAAVVKSGIYVHISMAAIEIIAAHGRRSPHLLLAYLILARFSSAYTSDGRAPNTLTGAGAQAVSERLKIRWSRAKILLDKLVEIQVIRPAPAGLKAGNSLAKFEMIYAGDIRMPVSLVDGLDDLGAVGGIIRLIRTDTEQLPNAAFASMLLLLLCYQRHDMETWGGVDSDALWLDWRIDSVIDEGRGFSIRAIRAVDGRIAASYDLVATFRRIFGVSSEDASDASEIFRYALRNLVDHGLLYECVALMDSNCSFCLPLRLNDRHAALSSSEASYIERIPGAGFYVRANNDFSDREAIRFVLPDDPSKLNYSVMGVLRLRFRCADPMTARGLERDANEIAKLKSRLIQADLLDDLDEPDQKMREAYR